MRTIKKLTKKDRYGIYIKSLENLLEQDPADSWGICDCISEAIDGLDTDTEFYPDPRANENHMTYYPEIARHEPPPSEHDGLFWWDRHNRAIREQVLTLAIKQTRPRTKNKKV